MEEQIDERHRDPEALCDAVIAQWAEIKRKNNRVSGGLETARMTVRLDVDLVEAIRCSGTRWHRRINDALRREFLPGPEKPHT